MTIMVSTGKGDSICKDKAEIVLMIKQGAALPYGDEIWVSSEENPYPCLSILVKGEYACVHYFGKEEGDIWQSCGEFEKEVVFLAGSEEWIAPAYVIISMETAINCMEEFCDTMERPKCIEWKEL